MTKRTKVALVVVLYLTFFSAGLVQAMSSTNFQVNWDSLNSGGDDISSSTNFRLRDTVGEQATGFSSSTNFTVSAGYRTGDAVEAILSFRIGTQENATQASYSAFSNAGKTVTVGTTSSYSNGDLIGVVENLGLSQIIAVGRITNISGSVITVDQWDGSPASLSASPSGGDDFVYRLGGFSAELGTLSASTGKTSLTATRVTSDATNGYTVYVNDDGNLRVNTSTFILDVSDGAVNVGSEEYGWRVFGTVATSTGQDYPFTTSTQAIQAQTTSTSSEQRVGLVYKASISPATAAGNYSHIVFYTLTANY